MPALQHSDMIDLAAFDPRLRLDIRYAGHDNFAGRPLYTQARAWLQRQVAVDLRHAHDRAREHGFGLLILDAYRPWHVTRDLWHAYPQYRDFVADPETGSVHNRGCAVDLTLFDLATSHELAMPSGYDEFSERAYPDYAGGEPSRLANRDRLRSWMEGAGFTVHPREWWHFDHHTWPHYPVLDIDFADLV
jgi:zinc D-Ala-D-Ala dipeptidase